MRHSTFPRSGILLLGSNSIHSLLPSTLLSQVESLLESHRIHDAVSLADQQQRKIEGKRAANDDEVITHYHMNESFCINRFKSEELRYVYQRIGFQCLSETLFEDAGNHLFAGGLDPRLLVSYFPDLRGSLFSPNDTIDVYAGVAEHMPFEASIDHISEYSSYFPKIFFFPIPFHLMDPCLLTYPIARAFIRRSRRN